MKNEDKVQALKMLGAGPLEEVYAFIAPFLVQDDADALYIWSCFSLPEWGESGEQFDQRRLRLIKAAAAKNVPEALFALGMNYDAGDGVERCHEQAARYFRLAAEQGCAIAKVRYGLDLFYGHFGVTQNQPLALTLIGEAVEAGVSGAREHLDELIILMKKC